MKLHARYKTASRPDKKRAYRFEVLGLLIALAGAVAFAAVVFPAGEWGRSVKGSLAWAFGAGRTLVPLWAVYLGLRLAWPKPWPFAFLRVACWAAFFFFFCVLCTLFGQAAFKLNYGGA